MAGQHILAPPRSPIDEALAEESAREARMVAREREFPAVSWWRTRPSSHEYTVTAKKQPKSVEAAELLMSRRRA